MCELNNGHCHELMNTCLFKGKIIDAVVAIYMLES
jgi:hypothetical protein